jgi:hypothetical protein
MFFFLAVSFSLPAATPATQIPFLFNTAYVGRPGTSLSNANITICDSSFSNCASQIDGGAISHFSPDTGLLTVVRSLFFRCTAKSDGGCIYFTGVSSQIQATCAFQCSAGRDGNSFAISLRGRQPTPNHLNESVVCQCSVPSKPRGWQAVFLGFGTVHVGNLNSSANYVALQASAFMVHSLDSTVSVFDATVSGCIGPWAIWVFGEKGATIERSNLIGNNCTKEHAILCSAGNTTVLHGRFIQNRGPALLQKGIGTRMDVFDCLFDGEMSGGGEINLVDSTNVTRAVSPLQLSHFDTQGCAVLLADSQT